MKQILTLALLCLACSFSTQAQIATNNTGCDVVITQICYNAACSPTIGPSVTVPPFGGMATLPTPCPAMLVAYEVCWVSPMCPPPPACAMVDANNPPNFCTGAGWTATLGFCPGCTASGTANVTYDPMTGNVDIN